MLPGLTADAYLNDIDSGDAFSFVVYQPGTTTPQPLSGWSGTAKVRASRESSTVILSVAMVLTTDASGVAQVPWTVANKATILAALGSGVPGVWGCEVTDGGGNVYTMVPIAVMQVTHVVPR